MSRPVSSMTKSLVSLDWLFPNPKPQSCQRVLSLKWFRSHLTSSPNISILLYKWTWNANGKWSCLPIPLAVQQLIYSIGFSLLQWSLDTGFLSWIFLKLLHNRLPATHKCWELPLPCREHFFWVKFLLCSGCWKSFPVHPDVYRFQLISGKKLKNGNNQ
jgi:hypothetical protein